MADEQKPKNKGGRPKGYKPSDESRQKVSDSNRKRAGREPRPIAERDAEVERIKQRKKELTVERRAQLGAEIMAREQAMMEAETDNEQTRAQRARWRIDKEKLRTHNQYITAIATLPLIDTNDPQQVEERAALYCDIAAAAGQRIVFETMALALGLSRYQLSERLNGRIKMSRECQQVYNRIRSVVDSATAEYAHSGESNAIATIFFAKNNQGYTNEDPRNIVESTDSSADQSNEEIAKKYGDLPL